LQITGPNAEVCNLEPIDKKLEAFGWSVKHVDGHDIDALKNAFNALPFEEGKPSFIIAHTVKGKGISYMENELKWHHGVPTVQQFEQAMQELDAATLQVA
jgi:transketolase